MRTQPQENSRGRRTVSGISGSAVPATSGPGWTAQRTGTGVYQIRFAPPFRAAPDVTVTPIAAGANFVTTASGTADSFSVNSWTPGGAAGDSYFAFNAQGLA